MQKLNIRLLFIVLLCVTALSLFNSCRNKNERAAISDNSDQASEWKIIGPGAGGGVFIPTISPFDTNLVFSKGDMTGNFVTNDGGKSWKLFNLMSVVQDFEFDPTDPTAVYASARGYLYDEDRGSGLSMLLRSDNNGETWRVIYPDISELGNLEKLQSLSFLPSKLNNKLPDGSIDMIRVDPADNKRIFLGLSPLRPYIGKIPGSSQKLIHLLGTENGGKDWKTIADFRGTEVLGIFTPHTNRKSDEITVITGEMVVKIDTKTGHVRELPHPSGRILQAVGGSKNEEAVIYLITEVRMGETGELEGGVFISHDGGEKWQEANGNLKGMIRKNKVPLFICIAACETRPEVVYLSVYTPDNGKDPFSDVRYEIYKSVNSGIFWEPVYSANSKEVLSHNFNDSWLNRDYGPGWGGDVLTLGVAPNNPDICYATDYGQAYKTSNGGLSWTQVCSNNNPDGSVSSRGLDLTCCYGVVFDPFDKDHLVISYIDIGLFHSFDRGKSWFHLVDGIPDNWVNTCYNITFDPLVKGRVWSSWANKHSLPRKSQFDDGLFKGYSGGVAFSEDGGKNWQKSNKGLPEDAICTDLLLDRKSPENKRTLYLSTFNKGIYKSVDNGRSWISSGNGLGDNQYAWELRMAGERIYLLCVRGWRGEKVINGVLYYSDDQAETWQVFNLPEGVVAPNDLLVDPENTQHMYLSCWPKHSNGQDICGGFYMTNDSGKNWEQCFDERIRVFAAAFDPFSSEKLFINTFQNGAFRSEDKGKTWHRISGYNFKWGHCPVPDPDNQGMLYLTTYGVSVYYGPANSSAVEYGRIVNIPDSWW